MAILNVEQAKTQGVTGIKKQFDASATHLIMDTIQNNQYQFPEASTVRELTSNAVDAQSEKEKILKILNGSAKVEDYYINRTDSKYKDSNFDDKYYDINWLDQVNNNVEISYHEGIGGGWCDKFVVKDYGVGLGDGRLQGYFNIGYSTKRNTTKALGGFGYGAKASLSLRNEYYDMTTAHNGRMFRFRCYSYKVDSLIGQFNEAGGTNKYIQFLDNEGNPSIQVYYEDTTSKNFTEITVPCKTFHRNKFDESIKSQLLYFEGVKYNYINSTGYSSTRDFKANVLYSSQNIIVSDQNQYSQPHIVVVKDTESAVGVCYGYVNFNQLEMQDLYSQVGFKCPMRQTMVDDDGNETLVVDGVEVTPSRESVIWSDHTRHYLQKIIDNSIKEAEELISNKLTETDFVKWLYSVVQVKNNSQDKVIRDISKIIDVKALKPIFSGDLDVRFEDNIAKMLLAFEVKTIKVDNAYTKRGYQNVLKRMPVVNWSSWKNKIYLKEEGVIHNFRKDCYIVSQDREFITITKLTDPELKDRCFKSDGNQNTIWIKDQKDLEALKVLRDKLWNLFKSSINACDYGNYEVPEAYVKPNFNEETGGLQFDSDGNPIIEDSVIVTADEVEDNNPYKGMTPQERRKLEGEIVVHAANYNTGPNGYMIKVRNTGSWSGGKWVASNNPQPDNIKFSKSEIKGTDFITNPHQVFYGAGEEDNDFVVMASMIAGQFNTDKDYHKDNELKNKIYNKDLKIIKVAANMPKKWLRTHKHIDKFFGIKAKFTTEDKSIIMHNSLIAWNTANVISKDIHKFQFMEGYEKVNPEVYKVYKEVKEFHDKYVTEFQKDYRKEYKVTEDSFNNIKKFCDKVVEFQLFVRDSKDPEAITRKSNEFFGTDTVEQASGVNLDIYDKLQALITYAEPVYPLLNNVVFLTNNDTCEDPSGYHILNDLLVLKGLNSFNFADYGVNLQQEDPITVDIVEDEEVVEELEEDPGF